MVHITSRKTSICWYHIQNQKNMNINGQKSDKPNGCSNNLSIAPFITKTGCGLDIYLQSWHIVVFQVSNRQTVLHTVRRGATLLAKQYKYIQQTFITYVHIVYYWQYSKQCFNYKQATIVLWEPEEIFSLMLW